jgi:NTP pyrophosphatase (non-canonical NTP hydrolase)
MNNVIAEMYRRYQSWVRTTTHPPSDTNEYCAVALLGELGELLNLIKKQRRGDTVCITNIIDEFGDALWYFTALCNTTAPNDDGSPEQLDKLMEAGENLYDASPLSDEDLLDPAYNIMEAMWAITSWHNAGQALGDALPITASCLIGIANAFGVHPGTAMIDNTLKLSRRYRSSMPNLLKGDNDE